MMSNTASTTPPGEAIRDHLIAVSKIPAETRRRLATHLLVTVATRQVEEYEQTGWVVDKELKTRTRMRKEKPHDLAFEDRVWAAFARLQFTHLNRDRAFKLEYGSAPNQTQQIDVFVADEEVVLVIECKSTETIRSEQFKKESEAIVGQRAGIIKRIREEYPQHKVKFILATNNFTLSEDTKHRLASQDIFHFSEDTVDYFLTLADHLGAAAKYQLLGALFAEQKIPNLEPTVPAIRGSMGGHSYYSFSIAPARLLKMAYVLHRNQANSELMPTYQRLIKKSRLKKVAEFVEEGGFFPNSIILNIETKRKKGHLPFDLASKDGVAPGAAKAGLLHLPQTYRAAYVIDGQHRLYGYANSDRAETDLIPVVAFVDLDRAEQVKLFMQINENQQAVPKNLRNTLNSDLLWASDDYTERARALRLRIAQHLGDQKSSPLYDRVIIGENQRTNLRSITIEAINNGLMRGNFIGSFTKTGAKTQGTFYAGDNQPTADRLIPFLEKAFRYLSDGLPAQWALGSSDGGFVFMNNGVEAYLRLLSDIVDHVKKHDDIDPLKSSTEDVIGACHHFLDPLISHLEGLSPDEGEEYRRLYGSGAGAKYYRKLQLAVRDARAAFNPDGLDEWLKAQDKQSNNLAREIVSDIEGFFKKDIRERLEDEYGSDWDRHGIPTKIRRDIAHRATEKNLDLPPNEQVKPWDMMFLIEYREILTQNHQLWIKRFEKRYTKPGDEDKAGGWKGRSSWIGDLNGIRNDVSHSRGISEEALALLFDLRTWLLLGEIDNEL
jgi:DNA sulfur modification protein DndB